MQLTLIDTFVRELQFEQIDKNKEMENSLNFGISVECNVDKQENIFHICFDFELVANSGYKLNLKYIGCFETDIGIDENFADSSWPQINGAAIVYPFLRAYVSNLTVNSGYDPAIIPSINFQQMYRDNLKSIERKSS